MIISKQNDDNSSLFTIELQNYNDLKIVIVVKKSEYLPQITTGNKLAICLTEEIESQEVIQKYPHCTLFFKDDFKQIKKPVTTNASFSDKIMQNLLKNTEPAISNAAKYGSFVYNELDLDNQQEIIVITTTENYADTMILMNPSMPETQEKSQIKKVICFPTVI